MNGFRERDSQPRPSIGIYSHSCTIKFKKASTCRYGLLCHMRQACRKDLFFHLQEGYEVWPGYLLVRCLKNLDSVIPPIFPRLPEDTYILFRKHLIFIHIIDSMFPIRIFSSTVPTNHSPPFIFHFIHHLLFA